MRFRDEYFFLSNMYPCEIQYGTKKFLCAEAAFQACKCPERVNEFTTINGYQAKKLGKTVSLVDNWEEKKIGYMYSILKIKFSDPVLCNKLINITDPIIEENTWGDTYWGVCNGKGSNILGKLLMKLQEELRFEVKLCENLAVDLQKLYVFDNKCLAKDDIMKSLENEETRKLLMTSLLKRYSKNKYRIHVRDLILIGKVVCSSSRTDSVDNQKYVDTIKKEINVIEKSASVDFDKNFEKHNDNLAVAISNAASGILKMPKDEIFDKLKDKDGRTEIMDSLGKIYMEKLQAASKRSAPAKEFNAIKMVINEIAALENPDLVKNKSSEKSKEGYSDVPAGKKNSSYREFASELRDDGEKKQSTVTKNNKRRR